MSLDRVSLSDAIARHGAVTRIVVAAQAGSAPRATGTEMLVWAGGQSGTIGGGALEHDAIARARALLADGAPFARRLLRQPLGPALGQCCGGTVSLLLERIGPDELSVIPDTGLFARPTASGPAADPPLNVAKALRAARSGERAAPEGLVAGWMIEGVGPARLPLWVWGAGHVGRAIVATAAGLPFTVTWIDDARARFPETIPPQAEMLVSDRLPDAAALAPADARHLVLTYSHALDLEICHGLLARPFASLGLIGSATKRARFLRRLAELGHPPVRLARLECPIGDPALGKEPQAIAVGVIHALLKETRAAGQSGATNRGHVA